MITLNLNDDWYRQDPVPRYFQVSSTDMSKFATWAKPYLTTGGIINVTNYVNSWSDSKGFANASGVYYKELSLYQAALQAYMDQCIAKEASNAQLPPPPKFAVSATVSFDAQAIFLSTPNVDAYFDRKESDMSLAYLRLFVSTPLFKGPGRYEFLCQDRRIVQVMLDRKQVTDVYFQILAKHSGKGLGVLDASTAASAKIVQLPAATTPHMAWRLDPAPDGHFELVARHSNQSINVPGSSVQDGTQVVQYTVEPNPNSKWLAKPRGNGWYQFVARHSGKCLAVADSSTADGAAIVQVPLSDADSTMWKLAPL